MYSVQVDQVFCVRIKIFVRASVRDSCKERKRDVSGRLRVRVRERGRAACMPEKHMLGRGEMQVCTKDSRESFKNQGWLRKSERRSTGSVRRCVRVYYYALCLSEVFVRACTLLVPVNVTRRRRVAIFLLHAHKLCSVRSPVTMFCNSTTDGGPGTGSSVCSRVVQG
jgi:hypothetical protein